ncbi:hypothetical protein FSP39_009995 [Pinctada imbricata]|uniref:Uncharacterized protein n=1 Tax=Pinctada imbricata TaxID=66713 RepID=A0AA88XIM0_PINIB|nr:hypothetical protein FSP39_009995 [Pinctada imbricata]
MPPLLQLQITLAIVLSLVYLKPENVWLNDHVTDPGMSQDSGHVHVNTVIHNYLHIHNHGTDSSFAFSMTIPFNEVDNQSSKQNFGPLCSDKIISLKVFLNMTRKRFPSQLPKPSKSLLFLLLLIIARSNDIETNPGPSNDSTKYMCGTCDNTVTWEHKGIVCETCDQWYHIDCQNIHSNTYVLLDDSMVSWHCLICNHPNYSTCPYDLHGISASTNTFESLLHHSNVLENNDDISLSSPIPTCKPSHQSTPKQTKKTPSKSKIPLRILNINFQSIKRKQHLVKNIIESTKPDIITGTETWLEPEIKNNEVFPSTYKVYRRDRKGKQGGSVLIAVKDNFISVEVEDLSPDDKCEMIWAKVEIVGCRTLYVSSFYNHKTSDEQSLKWFDISVRRASQMKNAALLIGGDFNLPHWDWKNNILKPNSSHQKLHYFHGDTLDDLGLTQVVEQPTRKDNILDLFITNLPNQVSRTEIMPGISDHDIVFLEFNLTPKKVKQIQRNIPLYKKANWDTIKNEINNMNHKIQQEANIRTTNELWIIFKTSLNEIIMKHIPHKKLSSKLKNPWVTTKTRALMKKRDRLYRKMKKSGNVDLQCKYKKLKHHVQKELRHSYWNYIEDIVPPKENDNSLSNMKRFWSFVKSKKIDYSGISSLKDDGKILTDPKQKSNTLNKQFQSVFSDPVDITTSDFTNGKYMQDPNIYPDIQDINVTPQGIEKLLKKLDPSKACGPDEIRTRILKELAHEISPILCIIYQKSLDTGDVPNDWRTAHVSPIYKKGSKYNPENYRPISLTRICCKILEHVVVSSIMTHADTHNILYPLQHGFRRSRSCETQLLEFIDDISKNIENSAQTDILVMDFSKAFDKVSHNLLLHKLNHYGIKGKINRWIKNFLFSCIQAVLLEGVTSDYVPVLSGVPQGSVLGPSLFLFYINDIPVGLNSTIRLFADDTIAYLVVKSNHDCKTLQNDLDKLGIWENKWKMAFHPDKCNVLSISKSKNPIKYDYKLHGQTLKHVNKAKYLGVTVQSDLKWNTHVNNITQKANKTLGFLKRNLNINSTSVKEQAYKSLIRPTLEYACSVWDPYFTEDINKIEKIQRRAARYVTGRSNNTSSVSDMLNTLQWRKLADRRTDARLTMMFKIVHNKVAISKDDRLIPLLRFSRNMHTLSFQIPSCRTQIRQNSFFPRTIKNWNHLPLDTVMSESVNSFKAAVSTLSH